MRLGPRSVLFGHREVASASLRLRSGQDLPAVPRACPELVEGASRRRSGGRGRPPDSRRDGGATFANTIAVVLLVARPGWTGWPRSCRAARRWRRRTCHLLAP